MTSRRLFAAMVVAWAAVTLQTAPAAWAQNQGIPVALITKSSALDTGEEETLTDYVKAQVERMLNGDQEAVATARNNLIKPLGFNASEFFKLSYGKVLVTELPPAVSSEKLLVRINAMIVLERAQTGRAADLAVTAMEDKSPAVRYWAAKTLRKLIETPDLLNAAQNVKLLKDLVTVAEKEESQQVLEQLLQATARMPLPRAHAEVTGLLAQRVAKHQQDPALPYTADRAGLQAAFLKIVDEYQEQAVIDLAANAWNFYRLAASQLADGKIPLNQRDDTEAMISAADKFLQYAHRQLGAGVVPPVKVDNLLVSDNYTEIMVRADAWRKILVQSPFGIDESKLGN